MLHAPASTSVHGIQLLPWLPPGHQHQSAKNPVAALAASRASALVCTDSMCCPGCLQGPSTSVHGTQLLPWLPSGPQHEYERTPCAALAASRAPAPVCINSSCCPGCLQGPTGPVAQAVLAWQDTLSPRSKGSSRRGSLMVRELTLHQLKALIEDVYASKRRADAR